MKRSLLFITIVALGSVLLLTSCGPMKYKNSDPAFSFDLVPGYNSMKKDHDAEVARYAAPTQYNIPVYAAAVMPKPSTPLSGSYQVIIDTLKRVYPGSDRFQVVQKKAVKLADGSDAYAFRFKWKWVDRVNTLKSVFVVAYKGDKLIYLSGTDLFAGSASYDVLEKNCMTLQLQ